MTWVCRVCCTIGVDIETWVSSGEFKRTRFLCKNCCHGGDMEDSWSPIKITEEEENLYWKEFQTDPTFLPPRLRSKDV